MEKPKQVSGSSSSLVVDLFGPKDSSKPSTSTGLFGSVFGPSSMGLGKDSSYPGRMKDYGSQYGTVKDGASEYNNQKGRTDSSGIINKDRSSIYQNETVEPCYFSSSIYYGGQEVYSPAGQSTNPQNNFRKDGKDDDPNGNNSNSASRGDWWQGDQEKRFLLDHES